MEKIEALVTIIAAILLSISWTAFWANENLKKLIKKLDQQHDKNEPGSIPSSPFGNR